MGSQVLINEEFEYLLLKACKVLMLEWLFIKTPAQNNDKTNNMNKVYSQNNINLFFTFAV